MKHDFVEMARGELTDLRAVHGKMAPSLKDQARAGRERALEYLQGSPETLRALGEHLVGALFAALGPPYFDMSAAGIRISADALGSGEDEEKADGTEAEEEQTDGEPNSEADAEEGAIPVTRDEDADEESADAALTVRRGARATLDQSLWARLEPALSHTEPVTRFIHASRSGNASDRAFLLLAVVLASQLIAQDRLRKTLRDLPAPERK